MSRNNLIKAHPAESMKGQFGPYGALYDGWESRRHNPTYDWIIIQLAAHESHLYYCDIDTSFFSGNEAPQSQVFGLRLDKAAGADLVLSPNDKRWEELLPVVTLGPNSRHIFELNDRAKEGLWSALMVRMIPDGGMSRFRAYGRPVPPAYLSNIPDASVEPINLLSPLIGGRIVKASDQNFSPPGNLLLPGRGHDMSDGWETRRSQVGRGKYAPGQPLAGQERKEWCIGRLGATGVIDHVEIDTAYHIGNYPVAVGVEACLSDSLDPPADTKWTQIVNKTPCGPHRQHWLAVEHSVPRTAVFSHVRWSIYPDGGLKRVRIFGHAVKPSSTLSVPARETVTALPLTYEEFKPYGAVIQGWELHTSAPKGVSVTRANQDTASKFHRLARVSDKATSLGCLRAPAKYDVRTGFTIPMSHLERSTTATTAFIPQGTGVSPGDKALTGGSATVLVVALPNAAGQPDLQTVRAFLATPAQGVSFSENVWYAHITVNEAQDYAVLGDASAHLANAAIHFDVYVPPYNPAPVAAVEPTPVPSVGEKVISALGFEGVLHPAPITEKAYAPFGKLIRAHPAGYANGAAPRSADKKQQSWLATLAADYPVDAHAVTAVGVFRSTKKIGLERGAVFDVRFLERHPHTTQVFLPMGKGALPGAGEGALGRRGAFLVVVALNGPDDRPDPATVKAFVMESGTGVVYNQGTWHHPVLVLDDTLDLACIETQICSGARGTEDARDCELVEYPAGQPVARVEVPVL